MPVKRDAKGNVIKTFHVVDVNDAIARDEQFRIILDKAKLRDMTPDSDDVYRVLTNHTENFQINTKQSHGITDGPYLDWEIPLDSIPTQIFEPIFIKENFFTKTEDGYPHVNVNLQPVCPGIKTFPINF